MGRECTLHTITWVAGWKTNCGICKLATRLSNTLCGFDWQQEIITIWHSVVTAMDASRFAVMFTGTPPLRCRQKTHVKTQQCFDSICWADEFCLMQVMTDLKCHTGIGLNLKHCVYSGSESTRVQKAINSTLGEFKVTLLRQLVSCGSSNVEI